MTRIPAASPRNLEPATDWRDGAACAGREDDTFFPVGAGSDAQAQTRHAKAVCFTCPSIRPCGQWALDTRQKSGVWGGLSESERRTILRRRGVRLLSDDEEAERTLQSLWDERTAATGDGHLVWTAGTPVSFEGHNLTPQRIGFRLGRGREPVGVVRKTCDRDGCVLPAHLGDQRDRDRKRMAARRAAERLAAQAAEREAVAS